MKKGLLLLSAVILSSSIGTAQEVEKKDSKEANDVVIQEETYNKWTVEIGIGQSKGTKPYTPGYSSADPNSILGSVRWNHYNAGVRYMFSPRFGVKLDGSFEDFENRDNDISKPFLVEQVRIGVQGVVNAARLFNIQDKIGRLGLLVHAGFQFAWMTPKLDTGVDPIGGTSNAGFTEHNLGMMFGISPTFRIAKRISITSDFSTIANFRQHYAWDGHYSDTDENLAGQMVVGSLGLTYSFGEENLHGDWAIIEDDKSSELAELDARVGELETMLNDADKDGVPDYLDVENNSIAGVAVDQKGRMVDINKNGVPDELEKYMNDNYQDKATAAAANEEMVKRLVNEGYVTAYFDYNKTVPTNVSTEGIDFMLTYLRNNPGSSIDIYGNADVLGRTEYNMELATKRAEAIKSILVKAGIAPERLNVVSKGEDDSVDPESDGARKLVRRVTFKIK